MGIWVFPNNSLPITHHPIFGHSVITALTKAALFGLYCAVEICGSRWNSDFQYLPSLTNRELSPAWETEPGCPLRLNADTGTSLYRCPILHSWELLSLSLLSLTSASGCFLLTCHGRGPESIKIHFSGFSLTSIAMGLTQRTGDDGYSHFPCMGQLIMCWWFIWSQLGPKNTWLQV